MSLKNIGGKDVIQRIMKGMGDGVGEENGGFVELYGGISVLWLLW